MKERDRKIKINFFSSLVLFILLVFSYCLFLYNVRDNQNTLLIKTISDLRDMENIQANYSLYKRLLKDSETERNKVNSIIVNKNSVADFIANLEKLAKTSDVEMTKTVSVEKERATAKESYLKVSLRARGELARVYYFMNLIENLPYKTRIRKMILASSNTGSRPNSVSVPLITKDKNENILKQKEVWVAEIIFELMSFINE